MVSSGQVAHRKRHAVFGRDTDKKVDVVSGRMAFQQSDSFLVAQLPQDATHPCPEFAVQGLAPILGDEHNMVFAVPLHMR
jgi:hypothetical protein